MLERLVVVLFMDCYDLRILIYFFPSLQLKKERMARKKKGEDVDDEA